MTKRAQRSVEVVPVHALIALYESLERALRQHAGDLTVALAAQYWSQFERLNDLAKRAVSAATPRPNESDVDALQAAMWRANLSLLASRTNSPRPAERTIAAPSDDLFGETPLRRPPVTAASD